MTLPVRLRIILGENDARKLHLPAGLPDSIEELCQTIKTSLGLQKDFRLQYQDADFGNEFVNLSVISEIQDKATIKVVFLQNSTDDAMIGRSPAVQTPLDSSSLSSDADDTEPASSSGSSPSTRHWVWPSIFSIPTFNYEAELQLEKANAENCTDGTCLNPSPKLKSHILERLSEEIVKFKAYPNDSDLNDVAEALVKKHPCLWEQGSFNGCYGWKISLKYKMANLRSKLRGLGCAEVMLNSLKSKNQDKSLAALNVKKPRRAEVNYCPEHPKGETTESLEEERIALLSEYMKKDNWHTVTAKMDKTFSYRRQEVLQGQPFVADFKSRWPALFNEKEIDNEFKRISTVPLLSTFFAALDQYSPRLIEIFRHKGGAGGRKIQHVMMDISKDDTIHTRRTCVLKSLCIYLNEDHEKLVKEYKNTDTEATASMGQTVLGVYVIRKEGVELRHEDPEDIGVLIEGVEVLNNLQSIGIACALLFGLTYCLNLSYPSKLKCTFEVLQKIFLDLDGQRLSSKAQFLKNKLMSK
ncbi:uncharacterized protein LOC110954116 [Acanthochromis polyacanthus]|uniref:uncharacterized protein LOC110954116 n=2 Tax=Acanthochromis polyacanthus TaxID=80966 RepID=UPI0022346F65|nr:uncharacterized protein LOC110954116 [Acanthochromis polyacanthus]